MLTEFTEEAAGLFCDKEFLFHLWKGVKQVAEIVTIIGPAKLIWIDNVRHFYKYITTQEIN